MLFRHLQTTTDIPDPPARPGLSLAIVPDSTSTADASAATAIATARAAAVAAVDFAVTGTRLSSVHNLVSPTVELFKLLTCG